MDDNDLFFKFFCIVTIVAVIWAFTLAIVKAEQQYQKEILEIQKCPCMEVQK